MTIKGLIATGLVASGVLVAFTSLAQVENTKPRDIASRFEFSPGVNAAEAARQIQRPFRIGVLRLNPELDQHKPLALSDNAGWAVSAGNIIGAFDERWLGSLALADGKVNWFFDGDTDATMPPTVLGSWVVSGFRSGRIVKLDALTGKPAWDVSLASFSERRAVLAGSTLLVSTVAQTLYAIDFQTGKTLWLFDGGFPAGLTVRNAPLPIVHDGRVIFTLSSGEVLAVNFETGKLLWRYNPAFNDMRFHDPVGELVIRNNQLYLTRYDGLVAAIDLAAEKRVIWQEQLPSIATSAFRNGRFYAGCVNGDVYTFDVATGRRVWTSATQTGQSVAHIMPGESRVYVFGANGRISVLDESTGKIAFHDDLGGEVASTPAVYGNSFVVATGLRNLYAYRLY